MKKIILALSFCSISLLASIGSSVKVPTTEHLKYTFGNHKKHPMQKLEKERYLRSLAPLNNENIQKSLEDKGYIVSKVDLKDVASELVYEVYAKPNGTEKVKLYVDPTNAAILKQVSVE